MVATLTAPRVIAAIADLADVHPILVPAPRILHLISSREIAGYLPRSYGPSRKPPVRTAPTCRQIRRSTCPTPRTEPSR